MTEKGREGVIAIGIYIIFYLFLTENLKETFVGSKFDILLNFIAIGFISFIGLIICGLFYFFIVYIIHKFIKEKEPEIENGAPSYILAGILTAGTVWFFTSYNDTRQEERLINCLSAEEEQLINNEIDNIYSLVDYCHMVLDSSEE